MGFVVCVERISGISQAGEPITVEIRSTTIFRNEEGCWAGCASPHRSLLNPGGDAAARTGPGWALG